MLKKLPQPTTITTIVLGTTFEMQWIHFKELSVHTLGVEYDNY